MDAQQELQPGSIASDVWGADLSDEERARLTAVLQAFAEDPFLRLVAARSLAWLSLAPGQSVLEVGCGSGVLLPALARLVAPDGQVVGIDHSPALLQEARATVEAAGVAGRVALLEGDAQRLPFPDASFDAAHVERVLMHVPDPDAVLREMRRVVRPGGWIVAAEPDYGGLRLDHPDQETMQVIATEAMAVFAHPTIGIELRRRMVEAGATETRADVFVETETVLHPMSRAALAGAAERVVAAGHLDRERATAALTAVEEADRNGTYVSYDHMVVTAGRVPVS